MNGRGLIATTALALALSLSFPLPCHAASQEADALAARMSDRMLAALAEANGVPGMGAAVVRDGKILWAGSAGYRDVEQRLPVDRHTVFRLASVSKVVAATAAAKLKEQGALDVDAPVQSMLPWLENDWLPMTSRQLAAHASGLPHYQAADEHRGGVHYASVRDAVGVFGKRALLSPPGTAYAYSSWGYTLLSAVIEARAGEPFLQYVARSVTPGLAIGPDATDSGHPAASRAYAFVDGVAQPAEPHDYSYTWAGGGFGATPEALAAFGGRLMAGAIVSPATFEWMLEPTRLADGTTAGEREFEVGFGWRVAKDAEGERIAHHAGVTNGARSALVLWPERKLGASVLSNALWVSSIEQTAMMLAAPFRTDRDAPAPAPRACPLQASRYEAEFDGKPFSGTARFALEDGLCVGRISLADGPLREWLAGFPQKDAEVLALIGLDPQGGFARAAFVSPIGLHDLRAQEAPDRYIVRFGASRALSIRF